jgi:thioredoxin 1
MDTMIAVTEQNFEAEVAASELPVLVDYWAAWCAPCRAMAPVLESLAVEHAGKLKVVKVDVDSAPGLAEAARIQGIPTLVLYDAGRERLRLVGARPKVAIEAALGFDDLGAAA